MWVPVNVSDWLLVGWCDSSAAETTSTKDPWKGQRSRRECHWHVCLHIFADNVQFVESAHILLMLGQRMPSPQQCCLDYHCSPGMHARTCVCVWERESPLQQRIPCSFISHQAWLTPGFTLLHTGMHEDSESAHCHVSLNMQDWLTH